MIRLIVFCLFLILSSANGFTLRDAPESGSIDETINVFSSIADDKNFTNVQPEGNTTERVTLSDSSMEVTVEKEKEKTETETEDKTEKVEAKPSTEATKPSSTTTTTVSTSTTTTTSTTTSAPRPINASNTTTVIKPVIINNDTDTMVDMSFVTNDSMTKDFFSSFDSIMVELNGANDTTNSLEPASGGMSSNDEFSNSPEVYVRSTRIRSIPPPKRSDEVTNDGYKPPIDVVSGHEMTTVFNLPATDKLIGSGEVTELPIDDKMEIVVDEPRTPEAEAHWSKFSKATGYKVIWASDKSQGEREAKIEIDLDPEKGKVHESHSVSGLDPADEVKGSCDAIDAPSYFIDEITGLVEAESFVGQDKKKFIKTVRCGLLGLSKILETQDEEIGDWTDESILPLKEISRLERNIEAQANVKCNCSVPLIGNVLHSIYSDPFLHEKRHELYKNHEWSSIIGDLRSIHVNVKRLYFQIHRHHTQIANLFNVSVAMSSKLYQWRGKQVDIPMNARNVRRNPYNNYNRG